MINCDINYVPNSLFDSGDSSKGPQLIGKTVVVSPQNGYRSSVGNYVGTTTNGARNDLMSGEIVSLYLNQYLTNAGITVVSVRERWFDQDQVMVDTGSINFVSSGTWSIAGFSIYTQVSATETATATFAVKVNSNGYHPVYVKYLAGSDRSTETIFKVTHTGGVSTVKLNQQIFNNVWQYLGIFHFTVGCSCNVAVSNQGSDTSKVVVVDAVRVGSGKLSGLPAWKSGAQDYMNSIGLVATDETICRNEMGEYVFNNTASASASDFIHIGFRINSGGTTSTGAETYNYQNTDSYHSSTLVSLETSYVAKIQSNFYTTINSVYTLTNRGVKQSTTSELKEGNIIPTFLAYPGFITNPTETLFMRKASGRDAIARGLYKGIARAFSSTVTILPVAVSHLMAQNLGNKQVKVCWKSNTDSLETSANPDGFKIYTSTNGYGFDNGFLIFDNSASCHTFSNLIVGQLYYFKVAAFNKGGESMTKNMVGVRVIPETQISASILFVDSFDRDFIFGEDEVTYRYQYNYIIQYGESISSSGYYFDSILNEYLSLNPTFLNSYSTVIWSCGTESSSDDSFSSSEQTIINNYLSNGNKNLFVSGSEIATDLNGGSQSDKDFLNSTLKAGYVSSKTTGYWFQSSSSMVLTGVDNVTFSTTRDEMYRLSTCDVISATEGTIELVYGGSSSGIGLSYNGSYRLIFLSFPFEVIDSSSDRNSIMSSVLNFFNVSTTPVIVTQTSTQTPTSTPTPTSTLVSSVTASTTISHSSATPTPTSSSTVPTETSTPTSTPTPTATTSKGLSTFNKIIIGSVVGGAFLLFVLSAAIIYVFFMRRKERRSEMAYSSSVKLDKLSKEMLGNNSSVDATLMNTQTEVSLPGFLLLDYLLQLREESQLAGGGGGVLMEGIIVDPELVKRNGFSKVAIKKTHTMEDEKNDNFHREISVMWSLAFDPHIAKLVGYCEQPSRCIVTKLYKCDLSHFLHSQPEQPLSFDLSLSFLKDISSGLASIHSLEIAHRDIKSANILLDQKQDGSYTCVICDFGLAAVSEDVEVKTEKTKKTNLKGFSPRYAAPEVFIRTRLDHLPVNASQEMKSDIYSFGILMWEILTRKTPWDGLKREDIEREVRSGSRPEIPKVNKDVNILFEIASTCWKEEPHDRPKASEIIKKLKNF